jgi:hypothetical protein
LAELYRGYVPTNVGRDAKYSIRHDPDDGEMKVHLVYRSGHRERALLSTNLHLRLVRMVNDVKIETQGVMGGVFYINEWGHVLVKTGERQCYYAGLYPAGDPPLTFRFDGRDISAAPSPGLLPGDIWPGPHAGIRYAMTASETDIYYDHETRPRVKQRHLLSEDSNRSVAEVRSLVQRLAEHDHRHGGGGRIYINEERQFFAPRPGEEGDELEYVYLGELGSDDPWFPEPSLPS